jgi:phosphatidate cytidylyltransferase
VLRTRLATAAVAIPALVWLVFEAPIGLFAGFIVGLTAVGLGEFASMAFPGKARPQGYAVISGMAFAGVVVVHRADAVSLVLVVSIVAGLLLALNSEDLAEGVREAAHGFLAATYVGFLLPHAVNLRALPGGDRWVFLAIACSMAADTAAYFTGRMIGRTPLAPSISPNKTIEGAVGAVFGSSLLAALVLILMPPPGYTWEIALLAGPLIGVVSQAGDLIESMFKRAYGAKDSGWVIPGHGGVLDRIDSLVLPLVFTYYLAAGVLF